MTTPLELTGAEAVLLYLCVDASKNTLRTLAADDQRLPLLQEKLAGAIAATRDERGVR